MDTNIQQDHPVSCTEYKSFWISWANNIIKVGKGNVVGMETFLTWNDQNPHPVNYVAFATGWGSTGKWKVMRGINLFQCMLSVIKIIIQKFKFFISHSRVHRGHRYKIQIQLTDNNMN
jgi:hypothetical protein